MVNIQERLIAELNGKIGDIEVITRCRDDLIDAQGKMSVVQDHLLAAHERSIGKLEGIIKHGLGPKDLEDDH